MKKILKNLGVIGFAILLTTLLIVYSLNLIAPDKALLKSFVMQDNELSFKSDDLSLVSKNYKIILPRDIKILESDSVHITYHMDRGQILEIMEIYVNNNLAWNKESKDKIELYELKQ